MPETKTVPNERLRYERIRRGWSQQQVADMVGTTPLNVGRWERGVTLPGPYFRRKLCQVYEKSARELDLFSETTETGLAIDVETDASVLAPSSEASTALWNVPYGRNLLFTGREDILAHLHDTLLNGEQPVALAQPQAISGLGGIGKTQTAVEYAYRYRDSYGAIFWVRADSSDLLSSDFLAIAALLKLPQRNEQDQNVVIKAVINWLDTHERWLLVLDNADELGLVSEFIPSAGKGHVLLTTRANSTGTVAQRIEIEKMGLDEGMLLLLRRMKRLKGSAGLESVPELVWMQAQTIVEAVDGLPLALDQAGAYIEETGCSLSDYLKFYQSRRKRLLRIRGHNATGHPEPVATTWSLSFEKVEQANPASAELLRLCAFLHPDEIPESMIMEGASELGPVLQAVAEDELDWNDAIGELRKYSLVKRDSEIKVLNIHRLVQAVIKDGMDEETQRSWAERVVRMVSNVFPDSENVEKWPVCQQYLPHAQMCVNLIDRWKIYIPQAVQVLNHTGVYLYERVHFAEADSFLRHALVVNEQTARPDMVFQARILNNRGQLLWMQGKYEESESTYLNAISMQEKVAGLENSALAEMLNNLAVLYNEQGKFSLGEPLLQRAVSIWECVLKADDPLLAHGISNLASLYDDLGKHTEAEPLYKRSLAIREKILGPEHPDTAIDLNNLAVLYKITGRSDQAEPLFKRALTIVEKSQGMEHPRRAATLDNLAQIYREQGKYEQAEVFFQQALTIREKVLGPEHPATAVSLYGLAVLYRLQEKYFEAELLLQRCLSIREQKLGAEHRLVASTLEEYAHLLRNAHRETESTALEGRAGAIRAKLEI